MAAKRRRYRRRFRRYRSIWSDYNVLRTKCEYSTPVLFPTGDGQPYFTNTVNNNRSYITVPQMMEKYARNNNLRDMFAFCKVTGFKIEAIPHSNNLSVDGLSNQTPVCVAMLIGSNDQNAGLTYPDLVIINTSMILDPTSRKIKYFSTKGDQFDLKLSSNENSMCAGTLLVRSMNDGKFSVSPGWNVKVTLYCYWRYAKNI